MKKFIVIIILCSTIVFTGLGCKKTSVSYSVPLEMWGMYDTSGVYGDFFSAYREINSNISDVIYRKQVADSYKKDLLNAMAAGNGPDIFMIHNSWLPDFEDKIIAAPEYMINEQDIRTNFVDVVGDDVIVNGQIYGLPLSVDSLGLYYNKDILNSYGITKPPRTWEQFDAMVTKLTQIDETGLKQKGAAIGTAYNVNRSMDILTALMMQAGAEMSDREGGVISFDEPVMTEDGSFVRAARDALLYYTNFATASEPVYTWNKAQHYSIDAFVDGSAAMMINYSWHYDTIKAKNAKLDFAVSDLPQRTAATTGTEANVANYWIYVVASNKNIVQEEGNAITNDMRIHEAWQLLKSLTFSTSEGVEIQNALDGTSLVYSTEFDFAEKYLENTGKPAARRDLIEKQITDVKLGPFAKGNLIARSWWRNEAESVDAIFADMIDSVNSGRATAEDAVEFGEARVQQLVKIPNN